MRLSILAFHVILVKRVYDKDVGLIVKRIIERDHEFASRIKDVFLDYLKDGVVYMPKRYHYQVEWYDKHPKLFVLDIDKIVEQYHAFHTLRTFTNTYELAKIISGDLITIPPTRKRIERLVADRIYDKYNIKMRDLGLTNIEVIDIYLESPDDFLAEIKRIIRRSIVGCRSKHCRF